MISGNGEKVYIIPCKWMANLVKYVSQAAHNSSSGPGKISVAPLLQKEDDTIGAAAESLALASADPEGNTSNLSSSPSSVDDRSARRERWSQMKQAKEGKVSKGLVFGEDYTLVGENVWMLLSSKFGFDVSLSLNIEEGSDDNGGDIKAAVDAHVPVDAGGLDCAMETVKRVVNVGGDMLSLPMDGRFDYSELVPDSDDEVSDDDGPAELVSVFYCGILSACFLFWRMTSHILCHQCIAMTNYRKQKTHQKEHNRCQYFFYLHPPPSQRRKFHLMECK